MPQAIPGVSSSTPPAYVRTQTSSYGRSTPPAGTASPGTQPTPPSPTPIAGNISQSSSYPGVAAPASPVYAPQSDPPGRMAGKSGLLRVVSNSELDAEDQRIQDEANKRNTDGTADPTIDLGAFIRQQWTIFRNARNVAQTHGDSLNERLIRAQRMFEGAYDPNKLAEIIKFGGSQVYSRLVAVKCRGASSLLRDVYLGPDRPWDIEPEPDPPVPPEVIADVMRLVSSEVQSQQQAGQPVPENQAHMRMMGLMHAAEQAARENANEQCDNASDKIDDILTTGRFYAGMAEFLVDLPIFPFACIKGPVVRMVPKLTWANGQPSMKTIPQMFWERVSPFDIYWTPGVSRIEDANVIQRVRMTRSDLNDLIGLPGYDEDAIRGALASYAAGLRDWMDTMDSEQALMEGRENPTMNQSNMIDAIEFHGQVQGAMLIANGVDPKLISDPDRDYTVQSWVVGRFTIKTQLNPNPRQRHPFFITSFEKAPGTVAGHGLADLLEDIQEVCNATLRSLVNNMSIASGPQVVVNDEVLAPEERGDELYPWKRWHTQYDPSAMSSGAKPVDFFQPQSNASELLAVYSFMSKLADENSAIPAYVTGSNQDLGGAGRTSSGLAMLMGNAEKILQTVASNIDNDVMEPLLQSLYDMIMLTDRTGLLSGDENIRVRGVNVAVQKETERSKQLQFLQITANPIDAPIIGPQGRVKVLRAIAKTLGLPDDVVPSDQQMQQQIDAEKQQQAAAQALQAAAGAPGAHNPTNPGQALGKPPPPGQGGPANQGQPPSSAPSPGAVAQGQQPALPTASTPSDIAPPVNLSQPGLPAA